MDLNNACYSFPKLSKAFISLFKFYLDDVNFIDEIFAKIIMNNVYLCDYHFFFMILLRKQAFVKIINNYHLIEMFLKMYDTGKTRILRVITNILELYQQNDPLFQKTNFNIQKLVSDLTNREDYFLGIFISTNDIIELNIIHEFISELLKTKSTHYFFVSSFCTLIEDERILNLNNNQDKPDVHTIYLIQMLSTIISFDNPGLFIQLEKKDIIINLGVLFFKEENLSHLHHSIFIIFQYTLKLSPLKHYRLINIVLSILEKNLIKWGREFFARENDKEWNMTSLNAYCLELYKEMVSYRSRLCKEFRSENQNRYKELMDRMDNFMKTDDFLFVKWYYERNIRSENLNMENEKDVELYFEDCISEAHVRYLYYIVMEHISFSSLFDK